MSIALRRYIGSGLLFGLIVLALGSVAGSSIASGFASVRDQALSAGLGIVANLIADPLIWLMQNPIPGAVITVVVWPVLLILLGLLFLMLVFGFGADAARDLDAAVWLMLG
ncbi:MAG: hypothetical protein H7Y11_03165 [Armatimonadetes bacterium]|nr:hypothetical protein [Anaerolineae bacterium]